MSYGIYNASVPVFVKMLGNLANIVGKAEAFAAAKKIDPAVLLATRLYPDMFPLSMQIQMTTMHVSWACALLAGEERPTIPNSENTFEELKKRIADAIAFANTYTAEKINGAETRPVQVKFPSRTLDFTGESYLNGFAMPNFYFHLTSTYAILRSLGVEVGKRDFTGG